MVTLGLVHVGDKGTTFRLTVNNTDISGSNSLVDLGTVDTMEMVFTDPDSSETTKTAAIANAPGTDGIISFTNSDATFIDREGLWHYRAKLTFAGGNIFFSENAPFQVLGSVE